MPTQNVAGPPYTITGLTPQTQYRVRVTAKNSAGDGGPSSWEPFTTTETGVSYPPETTLTAVSMPAAGARPGYLQPFTDPEFGTTITRISDQTAFSATDTFLRNIYSRISAWNADQSLILLGYTSTGYILDGDDYTFLRSFSLGSGNTHNWSNSDPTKIWVCNSGSNVLRSINATTGAATNVFTFSGYTSVSLGLGEGSGSNDGRYLPIVGVSGANSTGIVFDTTTDQIVSSLSLGATSALDWVSMSQSGDYVVASFYADGSGAAQGVKVYDRATFTLQRHLADSSEHADLGYDLSGNEGYVTIDYNGNDMRIIFYPLDGAASWTALTLPGWAGDHVSCRNLDRPGYAYLSDALCNAPSAEGFNHVYALKLDGTETVERFAHQQQTTGIGYDGEAMATVSRDGARVLWASDWKQTSPIYAYVAHA